MSTQRIHVKHRLKTMYIQKMQTIPIRKLTQQNKRRNTQGKHGAMGGLRGCFIPLITLHRDLASPSFRGNVRIQLSGCGIYLQLRIFKVACCLLVKAVKFTKIGDMQGFNY